MKKLSAAMIVLGLVMMAAALLLPFAGMISAGPSAGIIGGAGWPTYGLVFRQWKLLYWLLGGAVLAGAGSIFRFVRK